MNTSAFYCSPQPHTVVRKAQLNHLQPRPLARVAESEFSTWQVTSHMKSPRTTGNKAKQCHERYEPFAIKIENW